MLKHIKNTLPDVPRKVHLLVFYAALLLVAFAAFTPLTLWDENAYLGNARSHLEVSNFTEDFRFPLLEWVISTIWFFTGESILLARLAIILFALGTIYLVYLISKLYFKKEAFLITLFYTFSLPFLSWSFRIYTEAPSLFFVLLSFYLLTKENEILTLLAGSLAGIAFLFKFPLALFALSVGLFLTAQWKIKNAALFTAGFFIPLLPWFALNYAYHGNPLWDFVEQYTIVATYTQWQPLSLAFKNLFKSLTVLLFLLPIGLVTFSLRKEKWSRLIVLYVTLTLAYFLTSVNIKDIRYFFYILPFMIIISFDVVRFVGEKSWFKKFSLRDAMVFIIVLAAVFSLADSVIDIHQVQKCDRDSAIIQEISYLENKVTMNDTIISNHWPWLGYYLNVKVASIWSPDAQELIDKYEPKYFTVNDRIGDQVSPEFFNSTRFSVEKELIGVCGEKVIVYKVN